MEFCFSCMSKKNGSGACLKCGYSGSYECPAHHLVPGSILNGKYMIGNAIGEGGFGITYVGIDLNLERKVAIKEYFPSGIVTRNGTETITVFTGDSQQYFIEGREKFINEAKTLAKLDNLPGIVSVIDFFMENGTSYIVMEFVEGKSLKALLKECNRIDSEEIFRMMKPLIQSLSEVHKMGIIHRDISPDNIIITDKHHIKLIDFGAARDISQNKSLSIQLKPGYAPEEQYRTHGEQGTWTDVYALCATMYRAMTGTLPPESLERIRKDTLKKPSELGVSIIPHKENALMRGLELYNESRIRNLNELYDALYNNIPVKIDIKQPSNLQNKNKKILPLVAALVAVAMLVTAFAVITPILIKMFASDNGANVISKKIETENKPTPTPDVYNSSKYVDVSGRNVAEVADEAGMSLDEFLVQYDLPADMPGDTSESVAYNNIPFAKMAETYGMDANELRETLQLSDDVTDDTPWGEALDRTTLSAYVGEEYLAEFIEYYGLPDNVNGDTLWGEVRHIVEEKQRQERIDGTNIEWQNND